MIQVEGDQWWIPTTDSPCCLWRNDKSWKGAPYVILRTSVEVSLLPVSFICIAVVECNHFWDCQQASQFTYTVTALLPSGAVRDNRFMNEVLKNDPKHRQSCWHIQLKPQAEFPFYLLQSICASGPMLLLQKLRICCQIQSAEHNECSV